MAKNASPTLIYEEGGFLAVGKPAGTLTHPINASGSEKTLVDWVLERYPEVRKVGDNPILRPGIVHRLDRETSGILIVARSQDFFDYFKGLLQTGGVKKTYRALLWGKLPESGVIDVPIGLKSGTTRRTTRGRKQKMGKSAVTEYRALAYLSHDSLSFTLAELRPRTGRTHQLRVHMAHIGHPVLGDAMYGKREAPFPVPRQMLHAETLEFALPEGKRIRLEMPIPEDFENVLALLEKS